MMPYLTQFYGNPSSMHTFGGQVARPLTRPARKSPTLLGADTGEIVFTSCGTESDSTAILSAMQTYPEKNHVVTTRVEHPAVKNLCENLEIFTGRKYHTTRLPVAADGTAGSAALQGQPHRRDRHCQRDVGQQ
jgi:cysteine desulfurase